VSVAVDRRTVAIGAARFFGDGRDNGESFLLSRWPDHIDLNEWAGARCTQLDDTSLLTVTAQGAVYLNFEKNK